MTEEFNNSLGSMFLELDGKVAGFLDQFGGGEPFARVVCEPTDKNTVMRKQITQAEYAPMLLRFGTGMSKPLYQWMVDFFNNKYSPKNGAIIFLSNQNKELSRFIFEKAWITQVELPGVGEPGLSEEKMTFSMTILPTRTLISRETMGNPKPAFNRDPLRPGCDLNNIRFRIAGLEAATQSDVTVGAITVSQPFVLKEMGYAPEGPMEITDFSILLPDSGVLEFENWLTDFVVRGNNGPGGVRDCSLELMEIPLYNLNPTRPHFSLKISNLGILRYTQELYSEGLGLVRMNRVDLFCERVGFNFLDAAVNTIPVTTTVPAAVNPAASKLADAIVNSLNSRIQNGAEMVTRQDFPVMSEISNASETARPELVARRLLTMQSPAPNPMTLSKRASGESIGERWATQQASLDELRNVAALESGRWAAMRLKSDHSLFIELGKNGFSPLDGGNQLDLLRDEFVEGLVAGAARVLRSVEPHLQVANK